MTTRAVSVLRFPEKKADEQFDEIVEKFGQFLRNTIASICPKNLGLQIDDIEQDARIRLWKALEKKVEIRDYASYIYRIAFTATIDAVRRVKARKEEQLASSRDFLEDSAEKPIEVEVLADRRLSPDQKLEKKYVLLAVEKILNEMDENRRSAVRLYLQGFTSFDIAAAFGWTEPKARNLLYRGLNDLRVSLKSASIDYETI